MNRFTTNPSITDPTVVYCPLAICQSPVSGPPPDDPDVKGSDLLRICPKCNFSFCSFCLHGWYDTLSTSFPMTNISSTFSIRHGPVSDCHTDNIEELVHEYTALEWGSPERLIVERRYGHTIEAYWAAERAKGKTVSQRSAWELLVDKYMALPKDDPQRDVLEAQHGKALRASVTARLREEKHQKIRVRTTLCNDKQWVKENARKCPGCRVLITKESGRLNWACVSMSDR
jgi:hypothetical protein